jgi:hypothetical protein
LFSIPPFNWLDEMDKPGIHSELHLVALWEKTTFAFWQNVHRRDRSYLNRAPDPFVAAAPAPRQPRFGSGGGGGAGSDVDRRKGKATTPSSNDVSDPKDAGTRAVKPILRWKDSVPSNARSAKDLHALITGKNTLQPHFPGSSLVRVPDQPKICFGFCIEGSVKGCTKKQSKQCKFAHLDGDTVTQKGPDNFGSLTAFLAQPSIAEKLEYTDAGRSLSAEE